MEGENLPRVKKVQKQSLPCVNASSEGGGGARNWPRFGHSVTSSEGRPRVAFHRDLSPYFLSPRRRARGR